MKVQTKICGIKTEEGLHAAIENGANFVGFVFFPPSPRHLSYAQAASLAAKLPKDISTVAVTVDPTDDEIASMQEVFTPDYIQLHGSESVDRIAEIKHHYKGGIIKAIKISTGDDIAKAGVYEPVVDMILFDAKEPKESSFLPGGNGLSFDWNLLGNRQFNLPWMLSGGINADNIKQAVTVSGATIVDLSSSLENKPGIKDPQLVKQFLQLVHTL